MSYLLAGQSSELERLQLQSRVWEPAGRALLAQITPPQRARVLDVGRGVLGWLRVLAGAAGGDVNAGRKLPEALATLMRAAEAELARPETWGTTFTLIQAYGRLP
jgi:hypothetical protein